MIFRHLAYVLSAAVAFGFIWTAAAYAQDTTESNTNQGKGTAEVAEPEERDEGVVGQLVAGVLGEKDAEEQKDPARDTAPHGEFEDLNKPQQDVPTNKGKGTADVEEFERDRTAHYERYQYHLPHRYTLDRDNTLEVDREIESQTNQGKGTATWKDWEDADRDWRSSDAYWRQTDLYWRDADRRDDAEYEKYWESSDAYWNDSDLYWRDSSGYRTSQDATSRSNQGKGTSNVDADDQTPQ